MEKLPTGFSAADLHMHTRSSDGVMSPYAVINDIVFSNYIAEKTGKGIKFKIIAITDHDTIEGGLVAKDYYDDMHGDNELEIIIGAELTSANGHIVALNLKENIPPKLSAQETIDAIHEQGGIAIAAHPYSYLPFLKEFKGVGKLIYDEVVGKKFDAVEIRNSNPTETINNHITEIINKRHFKNAVTGGSDSHFQSAIGKAFTIFPGNSKEELFDAIKNHTTKAWGYVYGPYALYKYVKDRLKWKNFCDEDPIKRVFHDC